MTYKNYDHEFWIQNKYSDKPAWLALHSLLPCPAVVDPFLCFLVSHWLNPPHSRSPSRCLGRLSTAICVTSSRRPPRNFSAVPRRKGSSSSWSFPPRYFPRQTKGSWAPCRSATSPRDCFPPCSPRYRCPPAMATLYAGSLTPAPWACLFAASFVAVTLWHPARSRPRCPHPSSPLEGQGEWVTAPPGEFDMIDTLCYKFATKYKYFNGICDILCELLP